MRAYVISFLFLAPLLVAGCNTPPIPPGKPVDIPSVLTQLTEDLCTFKKSMEARDQQRGIAIDSVTLELDLSVDGSKNPQVAVAPDIQFMPTVSYGHVITAAKGSRLTLTLKNAGVRNPSGGVACLPIKAEN